MCKININDYSLFPVKRSAASGLIVFERMNLVLIAEIAINNTVSCFIILLNSSLAALLLTWVTNNFRVINSCRPLRTRGFALFLHLDNNQKSLCSCKVNSKERTLLLQDLIYFWKEMANYYFSNFSIKNLVTDLSQKCIPPPQFHHSLHYFIAVEELCSKPSSS